MQGPAEGLQPLIAPEHAEEVLHSMHAEFATGMGPHAASPIVLQYNAETMVAEETVGTAVLAPGAGMGSVSMNQVSVPMTLGERWIATSRLNELHGTSPNLNS